MKEIIFYNDPGHGWYEASVAKLVKLNIADIISGYSYLSSNGLTAYLEEDCDASTYFDALEASGVDMKAIKPVNRYSENIFVRSLGSYAMGVNFDEFQKEFGANLTKWHKRQKS